MTKPLTEQQKARNARRKARQTIVDAANRCASDLGLRAPSYSMRRIDQAVAVVRRRRLVSAKVLAAAGFNPGSAK